MKKITHLFLLLTAATVSAQNAFIDGLQEALIQKRVNNEWQNFTKSTYIEDANGYIQQSITDSWDVQAAAWVPNRQAFQTVTSDGNFDVVTSLTWNADELTYVNSGQAIYTYNTDEQMTSMTSKIWENDAWANYRFTTYNYANGKLSEVVSRSWEQGTYHLKSRRVYHYDTGGLPYMEMVQLYTEITNSWSDYQRDMNTFNADGTEDTNLLQGLLSSGEWHDILFSQWSYNSDGRKSSYLSKIWNDDMWNLNYLTTYSYATLGIDDMDSHALCVWPSPAVDKIQISGIEGTEAVSIYTADGRKCLSQIGGDVIDVSRLVSGVYILFAETERGAVRTKFVKQ